MIDKRQAAYDRFRWFLKRGSIVCAFIIAGWYPFSANALDLLFGTGAAGTFSHFAGRTICKVVGRHANDLNCKVVPAPDTVHNLTNLQDGALDIGLIDSRMLYDAMNKEGYFKFLDIRYDNLRALMPLYDVPIALVVRGDSKVTSLETLKGKRINAGAPRSQQHLAVDTIMKAKGWSKADFSVFGELPASQSQDTMAFCHGTIQAMVLIGVHPDPSLQQLFRLCKARLVNMNDADIEKRVNSKPAFLNVDIPAGIYPGQARVETFGTRVILVASADLDEQTVYEIMDAIFSNRQQLERAHPALSSFAGDAARKSNVGIELHPGAVRYLSEHGL